MFEKIAEFKALKAKISEIDNPEDLDYGNLDKFLRNIRLSIKHCFGLDSEYIVDLKEIAKSFPKDPGDFQFNDKDLAYQYVCAATNLGNFLDVVIADLERSQKNGVELIQNKKKKSEVFIVHGTDYGPVEELKAILKEANLQPLILEDLPCGSKTIVEKLEMYSEVDFAFVILTPDDVGSRYLGILGKKHSNALYRFENLNLRARQNVILEFGYFIGKLTRDKVCYLRKGTIEIPSDMRGISYIEFNESLKEIKPKILKELEKTGLISN